MKFSLRAFRIGLLAVLAACGGEGGGTTTTKPPGVATRVDVVTSPTASVPAGAAAGTFSVRVFDAAGTPVPGVTVAFSVTGSLTVSPLTASTDAGGTATTTVTAGTTAGAASVRGTVSGIVTPAMANVTVASGAAVSVVLTPETLRLVVTGDTVRVTAAAQDQFGNPIASGGIIYTVVDATLVSVNQSGLVTALRQGGSTMVIATSGLRADTAVVTVLPAGSTLCSGLATATTLAVGESVTFSGAQYGCLSGTAAGAEFALVAFNSSTDATNSLNVSVTGAGLAAAPSTVALRSPSPDVVTPPVADGRYHLELLAQARARFGGSLSRLRTGRNGVARSMSPGATQASAAVIPVSAKVGDIFPLNVSAGYCDAPVNRGVRVMAVGTRAIVLADTLNPPNGFSAADFTRIATNFDTLIYPMNVAAFGAPADIDGNGKVAIVFTRTVNELVDSNSGYFVGGFFNYRDIYPKVATDPTDNCAGSNEGELFYMVVPAPAGINGVTHTVGFVDSLVNSIVAHEFQHLINAERRLFVNTAATNFEASWLNEGLSHMAEELLYYRQSGWTPRQNLNDNTIRILNPVTYPFFGMDAASNLNRFGAYLANPAANSPYAANDDVPTRGAIWSFLRYAADQLGASDGTLWSRMANSTTTGFGTLQLGLGSDPTPFFRNWAVANFMDDFTGGTNQAFQHRSWNFRDLFTLTFPKFSKYPLVVGTMANNAKSDLAIKGGSAGYLRFAVAATKEGLITFSSGGGAPAAGLQFVVVRTK